MFYSLLTPRSAVVVQYRPWKGICVRNVTPRGGPLLDRFVLSPPPETSMKRIELRQQAAEGRPTHLAAIESNVLTKLPNLVAHCCITRYEDGSARKPGWWTLKTYGAAWVVQIKDPDSCCSLQATANDLDDALALAELLLGTDDAPWEPDPFLRKQKGK